MPLSWTVDRFYISPLDPLLFNLSRIVVALPLPQSVSNFESLLLGILRQSRCLTRICDSDTRVRVHRAFILKKKLIVCHLF